MESHVVVNCRNFGSLAGLRLQLLRAAAHSGPKIDTKIEWAKIQKGMLYFWQTVSDPIQALSAELGVPFVPQESIESPYKPVGGIREIHGYGKYAGVIAPRTLQKLYANELRETHAFVISEKRKWENCTPLFAHFFHSAAVGAMTERVVEGVIGKSIEGKHDDVLIDDEFHLSVTQNDLKFNEYIAQKSWPFHIIENIGYGSNGLKPLTSIDEICALGQAVALNTFSCLQLAYPNLIVFPSSMGNAFLSTAEDSYRSYFRVFGSLSGVMPVPLPEFVLSEW